MKLKDNLIVLQIEEAQDLVNYLRGDIRKLTLDPTYPVEERFELWQKYTHKKDHEYMFIFAQSKPSRIGTCSKYPVPKSLLDYEEGTGERYETIKWEEIYELVTEELDYKNEDDLKELQAIQEWFIQENFGSYKVDW